MRLLVTGTGQWAALVNILFVAVPAGVFYKFVGSEALALAWLTFMGGVMIPSAPGRKTDILPKVVERSDDPPAEPHKRAGEP